VTLVTSDEVLVDALLVRDVVSMGRFPYHRWWEWFERAADDEAIDRALAAVRIDALRERLFATLSAGERQRVWIALGLAQETPILLLDEPTSHLDVRVAHEILALLRGLTRAGKTVVCALHDLNEAAAYADRIALLGDSQLMAFEQPATLLDSALLERAYGIAMELVALPGGRLRVFAREPY
jgi:iron complex transport system ATP-binding protein